MPWLFWSIVVGVAVLVSLVLAVNEGPRERRHASHRRFGGPPVQHA